MFYFFAFCVKINIYLFAYGYCLLDKPRIAKLIALYNYFGSSRYEPELFLDGLVYNKLILSIDELLYVSLIFAYKSYLTFLIY